MSASQPSLSYSWQYPWHAVLRPALLVLLALHLVPPSSGAFALTLTIIDPPDALSTVPVDINAAGQIVGRYSDSGGGGQIAGSSGTHGFLREKA